MSAVARPAFKLESPGLRAETSIATAIGHLGAGRRDEAIRSFDRLTPSRTMSHAHCSLIGRVLAGAQAYAAALPWFEQALASTPAFIEALAGRAAVLVMLDRPEDAVVAFEAAFEAGLRDPVALYNYGMSLDRTGRSADALAAYDLALKARPVYPEALRAAGRALQAMGQVEGALHLFDEAIRQAPQAVEAVLDRAGLLRKEERLVESLATYDAAVARGLDQAILWNNQGMALHDLGRMPEALVSLDRALHLDPDLAQGHLNRGNVLIRLNRQQDALSAFDRAIALRPAYPEALSSRGVALKMLGRFDEARAAFDATLALDPAFIYALANRGELNLLLGQFEPGWPEYEYRFFTERQTKPALKRPTPEWIGPGSPRARVAVFADQGSGDSLQFSRYLPLVANHASEVTFVCAERLQRVLRDVTGGVSVRAAVADDDVFDYQVTLSSMPTVFKTDLQSLAGSRPYLSPEPALVRHWATRIGSQGLTVGFCWRGSQNWQCDPGRSVPFGDLAPLADVPGIRLFSLQMPDNDERTGQAAAMPIVDLSRELDTGHDGFVDTAAVMANLDLIISCDTSIAHLAGALGRPVWVLLQAVPEWRWLLGRDTSPWYPTMRLFRQTRAGDWTTPVTRLVEALRTFRTKPVEDTPAFER